MKLSFDPYQFPTREDVPPFYIFPHKKEILIDEIIKERDRCVMEEKRRHQLQLRDRQIDYQMSLQDEQMRMYQVLQEIHSDFALRQAEIDRS